MVEKSQLQIKLDEDNVGWKPLEGSDVVSQLVLVHWCKGYFFNRDETFKGFLYRQHDMDDGPPKFFADILELKSPDDNKGYVFFTGKTFKNGQSLSRSLVEREYLTMGRHTVKSFEDSTVPLAGIYWETGQELWRRQNGKL